MVMVGKVLSGSGITRIEKGSYALVGGVAQGCAAVELLAAETATWGRGTSWISTSQPSTSA